VESHVIAWQLNTGATLPMTSGAYARGFANVLPGRRIPGVEGISHHPACLILVIEL
jgi:hypothetical protein